jgi:hypothetical protein
MRYWNRWLMDEDSRDDIYIDVRYVAALRPTGRFLSSHMCFALPHFIVATNCLEGPE